MKKRIIKDSDQGYLERLTFDPALLKTPVASYLTNIRLLALVLIIILSFGIFGFTSLSRRLNPEIEIPIIFVSTILPGAGPSDVESLVTVPIEDALETINDVNLISSNSQDNVSAISIEFNSNIPVERAKDEVQNAIDTVTDLPDDATTPRVVSLDFEDVPVWTFAVSTQSELPSLFRFADALQKQLESGSMIKSVLVTGLEKQEIQIRIAPEKLQQFGLQPFQLAQAVQQELTSFPGGTVIAHDSEFSLTIDPLITTLDDIRQIVIPIQGVNYMLSDIAIVEERPAPGSTASYVINGQKTDGEKPTRVVTFAVYKLQTADIDATSQQANSIVEEYTNQFDDTFKIISIQDSGEMIEEQFGELFNNLVVTIGLVFLTLFTFLGIRQAVVTSLSIPLTFLISFGIMLLTGLSINFLSMFSLILALGLVVDDAIVVVSAVTSYYRTGKFTPTETGLLVWKDFIVPIWTTTLTTVWAFLPLLLATGIIGEFIKTIPIVVSSVLLSSTSVAVLITLPLMMIIIDPHIPSRVRTLLFGLGVVAFVAIIHALIAGNPLEIFIQIIALGLLAYIYSFRHVIQNHYKTNVDSMLHARKFRKKAEEIFHKGIIDAQALSLKYEVLITKILESSYLRKQTIIIVIVLFIFSIILFPLGFIQNEFFPKTDEEVVFLSLEMPAGTTLDRTEDVALEILDDVVGTPETEYITLELGRQVDDGSTISESQSNRARLTLNLTHPDDRDITSIEIAEKLRDQFKTFDKGTLNVIEQSGGPPVGSDIQIKYTGEDLGVLNDLADKTVSHLEDVEGVTNITKSINPGTSKISFVPDRQKLAEAGVSVQDIGFWIRTFTSGFTLDETRIQTEDKQDITLRLDTDYQTPEALSSLSIPTQTGRYIPLLSLGDLDLRPKPTLITREDGERTISVSAAVTQGFNIPQISAQLEEFADNELTIPDGYVWSTGGVNEENNESVKSILQAMVLAFIIIFGTMVLQLKSFRKATIVLLVIPLALSGVFIIFALTGTPLSFPALIGVLALYGIVVNNSIVVVEKINQNLAIGMEYTQSIADASASRLQPILFSSLTTIIGLLPITLSDPLWRGLGGAIIAGLTFSGTIMLLFIPVVYYRVFEGE